MNEKTASVHWEGQGKKGLGKISTETGVNRRGVPTPIGALSY